MANSFLKKLCHNYFPCLHLFGSEIWDRARRERGQREREREREREKWCEAETSYLTDPARRQKRRSEKGFKNFPASDCGCSQMLPKDISKNSLVLEFGVPPQLSGFFRAFHPAAPGLNPKYTIDGGFFNLNCDMLKRRK